jgi:two-component system chemotaxis response regulator CheY
MSLMPKRSASAPRDIGAPRPASTSASILIVDDSLPMRSILRSMLTSLGYQNVEEAENGQMALAMIRARSYTLIISDWHMEPMTGIELLREVRRISRAGSNRFIFSTSERSWGSQTTAKLDGAEAFLTKPFTVDILAGKINEVLR